MPSPEEPPTLPHRHGAPHMAHLTAFSIRWLKAGEEGGDWSVSWDAWGHVLDSLRWPRRCRVSFGVTRTGSMLNSLVATAIPGASTVEWELTSSTAKVTPGPVRAQAPRRGMGGAGALGGAAWGGVCARVSTQQPKRPGPPATPSNGHTTPHPPCTQHPSRSTRPTHPTLASQCVGRRRVHGGWVSLLHESHSRLSPGTTGPPHSNCVPSLASMYEPLPLHSPPLPTV
jgi:hypothetical protein